MTLSNSVGEAAGSLGKKSVCVGGGRGTSRLERFNTLVRHRPPLKRQFAQVHTPPVRAGVVVHIPGNEAHV